MKRKSWLRLGLGFDIMFLLLFAFSPVQSHTSPMTEASPIVQSSNHQDVTATSVSNVPTATITIDELGMWVTWTHSPSGKEINGGPFMYNVVTGDLWWTEHDFLVRWSETEGMDDIDIAEFGYPDEWFSAFSTDYEGNIWLGLNTGYFGDDRPEGGVLMLALDGTKYDFSDKVEALQDIAADMNGNRWFFERDYMTYFDGETWDTKFGYSSFNVVQAYYPDVLSIIPRSGHNPWYVELPDHVWDFNEFIGPGASVYDGTQWTTYTVEDGLAHKVVYHMVIDQEGHKWFATAEGVSILDDNGTLDKNDDSWLTYNDIELINLAVDHDGKVWGVALLTDEQGIRIWDGQSWMAYTASNSGLMDNKVYEIFVDNAGVLWFSTRAGLTRLFQDYTSVYLPIVNALPLSQ